MLSDKERIELQIQAGILTDDSLMDLINRSSAIVQKLSPIKKRFPNSTVGFYLLDDIKEFLRSDLDKSRNLKRKKGELLNSLLDGY